MAPDPALVARFAADLDRLIAPGERLGLAVSGGPDSLALLILAAAARPGLVEAASVDHRLRHASADECMMVERACADFGVPHRTLVIEWEEAPSSAIQERARNARYTALADWMRTRGLTALATGHHGDDQAETLVMRLARGSGVRGLAAMRTTAQLPGASELRLIRPLLDWRRAELESICNKAGFRPVDDPSNRDQGHERVRVRSALAGGPLDSEALTRSAQHLAAADEALDWAVEREWQRRVEEAGGGIAWEPEDCPGEIRRRIIARAIQSLGSEGNPQDLRGRELDQVEWALDRGESSTLRGVHCRGGRPWRFRLAPKRNATARHS